MIQWIERFLFGAAKPVEALPAGSFSHSQLMLQQRQSDGGRLRVDDLLLYRIKRDALQIVADMNRGNPQPNFELMTRQLAFVQKELIQAAFHDEALPKTARQALARYHAQSIRQGLVERRNQNPRPA